MRDILTTLRRNLPAHLPVTCKIRLLGAPARRLRFSRGLNCAHLNRSRARVQRWKKLRIGALGFGTGQQRMALGRWTNCRVVRGLSGLPPEILMYTIRKLVYRSIASVAWRVRTKRVKGLQ